MTDGVSLECNFSSPFLPCLSSSVFFFLLVLQALYRQLEKASPAARRRLLDKTDFAKLPDRSYQRLLDKPTGGALWQVCVCVCEGALCAFVCLCVLCVCLCLCLCLHAVSFQAPPHTPFTHVAA